MRRSSTSVSIFVVFLTPAFAESQGNVVFDQLRQCRSIVAEEQRTQCFDKEVDTIVRLRGSDDATFVESNSADRVLWSQSGGGDHVTRPFHIDGPWELQWVSKGMAFFKLETSDGDTVGGYSVDKVGVGSAYQPDGGDYILDITTFGGSDTRWLVRAVHPSP